MVIRATITLVKKDLSDKETPEHVPQPQSVDGQPPPSQAMDAHLVP